MECDVCKKKDNPNLKIYLCDGCHKGNCMKCSNLTSSETRVLDLKGGRVMKFYCQKCTKFDTYTLLNEIIEDKSSIISSKEEIIQLLKQKLKDYEEIIEKKSTPLFSQVLQSNKQSTRRVPAHHENNIPNIIITPKNPQATEKTKNDLYENINLKNLKIGIKNTRPAKNGAIIIKCNDKKDIEVIKNEAENKLGNYDVHITKMRNPKFKIIGYSGDLDKQEIEECLREQNSFFEEQDELKITYLKQNNRNATVTVYGEASPILFQKLMINKKIFLQWNRYPIYEDIGIQRCFKCQEHYHKNTNCVNKTICEYCASEHIIQECPKLHKKCNNCINANGKYKLSYNTDHEASDQNCPSYQYLLNILRSKINYGGHSYGG